MPVLFDIRAKGANELRTALERLRVLTPRESKADILDKLNKSKVVLSTPAPKPSYPINWDSEKQRRAFFATDGFGGGIPYSRTGKGSKGWRVEETPEGGRLFNPYPQAVYVFGDENGNKQSRIHKGRWPLAKKTIDDLRKKMPPSIQSVLTGLIRRLGLS